MAISTSREISGTGTWSQAFYDRRPRVREIFGRSRMDFEVDGVFFHKSKITSATTKRYASQEEKYGDAYRSWWNCESRINDMDKYGWDIQVCLPTAGHVGSADVPH